MKQQTLLKLINTVPITLSTTTTNQSTTTTTQQLNTLTNNYQTLYHSSTPINLITPVTTHLHTITTFLQQNPNPLKQHQILHNHSHITTLTNHISFFNLNNPISTHSYYQITIETTQKIDNPLLVTTTLKHLNFIPTTKDNFTTTKNYLRKTTTQIKPQQHTNITS